MDNITNFGKAQVSTGYDSTATSIVLAGGNGARLPDPPFNLVWWNATDYGDPSDDPNVEIVRCTGKASDTLTIVRAQEETTASIKNLSGKTYKMILAPTKKVFSDIDTEAQTKVNTHAALTSTHGVTKIAGIESDGSIILSTFQSTQIKIRSAYQDFPGGASLYYGAGNDPADGIYLYICFNCEHDGINWNRVDTEMKAWRLSLADSGQYISGASPGQNPITAWDLASNLPVLKSHSDGDVSTSVHPNAERLANRNASNGYLGLDVNKEFPHSIIKVPSANLRNSNPDEVYAFYGYWWRLLKKTTFPSGIKGILRVSFDLALSQSAGTAYGRIYKNGVPIGTEQSNSTTTYVTKTEDIDFGTLDKGGSIELWGQTGHISFYGKVRNLNLYYDNGSLPVPVIDAVNS